MFRRLIFTLALLLLSTPFMAMADVSEATFTPQGNSNYPPIDAHQVEVYVFKPEFKFKVIGVVEARGMAESTVSVLDQLDVIGQLLGNRPAQPGEKEDIALAMRALRKEAAQAGAMGLVIVKSFQARVSPTATERRIVAVAIRPE